MARQRQSPSGCISLGGERSLPLKAGSEDALQAEGESAFAGRGRETAPHGGIVGKGELT